MDKGSGGPGEQTGIAGFDYVTQGLPRHGVTMLIGKPGTGKTVMSLQIAAHAIAEGRDVVFFSVYSEPHEKLIEHMRDFSFFDPADIGLQLELISLKSLVTPGGDEALTAILKTVRGKRRPLVIIDGYGGLRSSIGPSTTQELLASLSSQMPYHHASCLIAAESEPLDAAQYAEMASADAIVVLYNQTIGTEANRTLEVLKMRGHGYCDGLHSLHITDDGIQVFPRPTVWPFPEEHGSISSRKRFDLPEFDRMLGGGLPELSTTVFYGDPGTGKTTFGLHYLLAGAAAGEPGLLVTFREPLLSLYKKAGDLGLDLEGAVKRGTVQVLRMAPVRIDPDEVAWTIRQAIEQNAVQRVVIDGIIELERAVHIRGSANDYLAALSEYLWRVGVTPVLLQDGTIVSREFIGAGVPGIFSLAQNRVLLRRVEYEARLYRICTILNMQASDHDTSIREFNVGPNGITILERSESKPGVLASIALEQPIRIP